MQFARKIILCYLKKIDQLNREISKVDFTGLTDDIVRSTFIVDSICRKVESGIFSLFSENG